MSEITNRRVVSPNPRVSFTGREFGPLAGCCYTSTMQQYNQQRKDGFGSTAHEQPANAEGAR